MSSAPDGLDPDMGVSGAKHITGHQDTVPIASLLAETSRSSDRGLVSLPESPSINYDSEADHTPCSDARPSLPTNSTTLSFLQRSQEPSASFSELSVTDGPRDPCNVSQELRSPKTSISTQEAL